MPSATHPAECRHRHRGHANAALQPAGATAREFSGRWSILINDQWRGCFRFDAGDAFDVEIVDHHRVKEAMRKKNPIVIHLGEFLAEMLAELKLSQAAFARAIRVEDCATSGENPSPACLPEFGVRPGNAGHGRGSRK